MKISKIEFENFRNFKEHGEIKCSTDGKVTIVYGKNGDGKTTLHQLFQWVFYGTVHFNKTTTERLYNLEFESELKYGDAFKVMGRVDFEHEGASYSLTRTQEYRKGIDDSQKISESVHLNKMDADFNWVRMDNPKEIIEKLLPVGLSEYFFFEGESMIADLRVKGQDSAEKLKKALYTMFDLDILQNALNHIGKTASPTTVLGKLFLSKGTIASGSEISAIKTNIENAQAKISALESDIDLLNKKIAEMKGLSQELSEKIGSTPSKMQYELTRAKLKDNRDTFLQNAEICQSNFGDTLIDMYPPMLIYKSIEAARDKLKLKVDEESKKIPSGLNKPILNYLLEESTHYCLCGHELGEKERKNIEELFKLFPPTSWGGPYNTFSSAAKAYKNHFDSTKLDDIIKLMIKNRQSAESCDIQIHELDDVQKKAPDVEDLIVARSQAEDNEKTYSKEKENKVISKKKYEIYRDKQMAEFDKLTSQTIAAQEAQRKIAIMQDVYNDFETRLSSESLMYSEKLENNIQALIDCMLTSKRKVSVSQDFSVRITDSYNDESKSEGQFAVVSFAYIGGILKMLKSEDSLSSKEYPLVLDGPFSKLDPDQRLNVVKAIPSFAPQVILFSKDDLSNVFPVEDVGRVYTIESNAEKNVAKVKEGFLWI